jgi:hypothetical protein
MRFFDLPPSQTTVTSENFPLISDSTQLMLFKNEWMIVLVLPSDVVSVKFEVFHILNAK